MTDSTTTTGRPRLYHSPSEKVQAFRQRLASGGYLRREVLLTQPVAERVAALAKEHKVSTIDVTSALLEQGLAQFESSRALQPSQAPAGAHVSVGAPMAGRGALSGVVQEAEPLLAALNAAGHIPVATRALPCHGSLGFASQQAFASSATPRLVQEPAETLTASHFSNPITDFFNRRKETLNDQKQ